MKIFQLDTNAAKIDDAEQVGNYLTGGATITIAAGKQQDTINPEKGMVVPVGWSTDGTNVWPLSLAYYLQNYQIGFDESFLADIRSKNYVNTTVSDEQLDVVRKEFAIQSSVNTAAPENLQGDPDVNPFGQ